MADMDVPPARIHRLFYPQVPLVLTASYGGRVSAMPVVAYAMASVVPPVVSVSCNPDAFTLKLALKARAFALCLLKSEGLTSMEKLATISGAKVRDKLQEAGIRYRTGAAAKAPVITDSAAVLECTLRSSRRVGDHVLILGTVRASRAIEDFEEFWAYRDYEPILYAGWKDGMTTYNP